MSKYVQLPELPIWLARLGANEEFLADLLQDPLLSYAYFAALEGVIPWPDDVRDKFKSRDDEVIETEDMLKLMASLKQKTGMQVSSQYITVFNNAVEIYAYYRQPENTKALVELLTQTVTLAELGIQTNMYASTARPTLDVLAPLANFSALDSAIVMMSLALHASSSFAIFMALAAEDKARGRQILPKMLDCTKENLLVALNKHGALAKSGIIPFNEKSRSLAPLSEFWTEFLISGMTTRDEVFNALLQPFETRESAGAVGRLHPDDADILSGLFSSKAKPEIATNVLLYGPNSVNKKAVVMKFLHEMNLGAWVLNSREAHDSDYASLCFFAQRLLAETHPGATLVVDKTTSVLSGRKMTQFLFFQIEDDEDDELSTLDKVLLQENPVRTIWMAVGSARLSEETLGCFLFHAEIKRGSRLERKQKVEEVIRALSLSETLEQNLIKQTGLSEQQLHNAVALSKISAKGSPEKAESHILHAVLRSQAALNRKDKDDIRVPITQYSLEYLNTEGKFGPTQILKALRERPFGRLCLYGIPGTGKSAFAEYIASELDRPLLARRASDLLDKYVGESEKRIAEMFQEAEQEEACLLLDEGDTFLQDRRTMEHQWQVSQVNELLQRMERFQGLFILATNLFENLDDASLRRFNFKLEFLALNDNQRWEMFLNESGLRKTVSNVPPDAIEEMKEKLNAMAWLTPGDFATVKSQCILLGEALTPDEWLDQLQIEVKLKQKANTKNKLGF